MIGSLLLRGFRGQRRTGLGHLLRHELPFWPFEEFLTVPHIWERPSERPSTYVAVHLL